MGRTYRETRSAFTDTVKRIALDPLEIEGIQVVALTGDEYVRFTLYRADGTTVFAGPTDATYETIYTNDDGIEMKAWGALVRTPATLQGASSVVKEKMIIKWEYLIGAADDLIFDYLEVLKRTA